MFTMWILTTTNICKNQTRRVKSSKVNVSNDLAQSSPFQQFTIVLAEDETIHKQINAKWLLIQRKATNSHLYYILNRKKNHIIIWHFQALFMAYSIIFWRQKGNPWICIIDRTPPISLFPHPSLPPLWS